MGKPSRRQRGLVAIRAVCNAILEMTHEANADPLEILSRLQGISLLLDPFLRRPATRERAIRRLAELTWRRLEEAEAGWRDESLCRNGICRDIFSHDGGLLPCLKEAAGEVRASG
jgi:hypothetical protein